MFERQFPPHVEDLSREGIHALAALLTNLKEQQDTQISAVLG